MSPFIHHAEAQPWVTLRRRARARRDAKPVWWTLATAAVLSAAIATSPWWAL